MSWLFIPLRKPYPSWILFLVSDLRHSVSIVLNLRLLFVFRAFFRHFPVLFFQRIGFLDGWLSIFL